MNANEKDSIIPAERERRKVEDRRLNDLVRRQIGDTGRTFISPSLLDLSLSDRVSLDQSIKDYEAWDDGKDPNGTHGFGCLYGIGSAGAIQWTTEEPDDDVSHVSIMWKIDISVPDMNHGAEKPWSETESVRILTIMLVSDD